MLGWKPSDDFIEKSRARLTSLVQERFTQKELLRKDQLPAQTIPLTLLRNLAKDNKDIEQVVKDTREKSAGRTKNPRSAPVQRKVEPSTRFGSVAATWVPPYEWTYTWNADSGQSPQDPVSSSTNGHMSFAAYTGDNGKTASCIVAVGGYFRPVAGNYVLDVSSVPSFTYDWFSDNVLDSSHTAAWIGIIVGEYNLDGEFVQYIVHQQISLWNSTGSGQGSNSGFPLFSSCPIDNDHFYEIWVWAGGDAEADGWSVFWGSAAFSEMTIFVPSISIYAY